MYRKIAGLAVVVFCLSSTALVAQTRMKARVSTTATALSALLHDAQSTATFSADTWKRIANEAVSLSNRLYGHTAGSAAARKLAREVRAHVREMHKEAMAGNAEGAKSHAGMALPYVNQLVDWAAQ